jgi:hypothetical protein
MQRAEATLLLSWEHLYHESAQGNKAAQLDRAGHEHGMTPEPATRCVNVCATKDWLIRLKPAEPRLGRG